MADLVNVIIDGIATAVPKGTNIVDAAKMIGNEIPVFCYHPKLKQVGMCRMCLVEIGTPKMDPATKQIVKDEQGNVVIAWQPKLSTGCTTPVSEGMSIRTKTQVVKDAEEDVLEFLLTSHPLDCPVCDKGGECSLQDLTLQHGPGTSRFEYENKHHGAKHVPLGDLIWLDRERCIQCSRCIRFQDDIADDHVLQFSERGRNMEIVTMSQPGFDSYFSGNTTDICPVGALTTADFRFKARAWEMQATPSVCEHCPVGCNITLNTRLETKTGGHEIKRVMPRQNEQVNEIWLCDKGRFTHHFTRAQDRIQTPLIRKDGKLVEATWEQALQLVADNVRAAGTSVAGVLGDRIANEDAWLFAKLMRDVIHANNGKAPVQLGMSPAVAAAYAGVARAYGVGKDFDMTKLGKGDVVVIVNGDVEEQAPVWMLRLRQAIIERGAKLIVAHSHGTKMHRYAAQILHYAPGMAANWARQQAAALAEQTKDARNLLVVFGDEKLNGQHAGALALALAELVKPHAGKANSGLLPLYAHANTQGVFDMLDDGSLASSSIVHRPSSAMAAKVGCFVGVGAMEDAPRTAFSVVQELFMTDLAAKADVVLPALSFAEREGSFTSADRRVQRFYRALPAFHQAKPDWWIAQEVAKRLGASWSFASAAHIFADVAANVPQYAGLSYEAISQTTAQWPPVGRDDMYYGGTTYESDGGLGVRYASDSERGAIPPFETPSTLSEPTVGDLTRPEPKLYRDGELIRRSSVVQKHIEH